MHTGVDYFPFPIRAFEIGIGGVMPAPLDPGDRIVLAIGVPVKRLRIES